MFRYVQCEVVVLLYRKRVSFHGMVVCIKARWVVFTEYHDELVRDFVNYLCVGIAWPFRPNVRSGKGAQVALRNGYLAPMGLPFKRPSILLMRVCRYAGRVRLPVKRGRYRRLVCVAMNVPGQRCDVAITFYHGGLTAFRDQMLSIRILRGVQVGRRVVRNNVRCSFLLFNAAFCGGP